MQSPIKLFFGLMLLLAFQCAKNGLMEKVIYVGPELVDCVGVAPQKCLQVKEEPGQDWRLFYGRIEGFDYEPGYNYTLKIRETKVENPPADASSLKWTLVEVVGKE